MLHGPHIKLEMVDNSYWQPMLFHQLEIYPYISDSIPDNIFLVPRSSLASIYGCPCFLNGPTQRSSNSLTLPPVPTSNSSSFISFC